MTYQSIHDGLTSSSTKESRDRNPKTLFLLVFVAEVLLWLAVLPLLLCFFLYFREGFAWNNDDKFNLHPLCMVIAFVILYPQGALIYRILPGPKIVVKLVHGGIFVAVMGLTAVGLVAVFTVPRDDPHLYSLHSWLGLMAVGLLGMQYLCGLFSFLIPIFSEEIRHALMPLHRFGGLAVYILATVTMLSGIQDLMDNGTFKHNSYCVSYNYSHNQTVCNETASHEYSDKAPAGICGNCLGLGIIVATIMVAFIVTQRGWQRKPYH